WTQGAGSAPLRRPQLRAVAGGVLQVFLDPQQLVVLGDAVGPAGRAGLDLARVGRHGQVGDGHVLRLAAAVADDRGVAVPAGQLGGVERLGQRADLVHLDEDAVGRLLVNALPQALHVGDEQIVPDQLHAAAELLRQLLPARPVVFGQAVFDGADRPAVAQ